MENTLKFGGKKIAMIAFITGVLLFQIFFWTILYPKNNKAPEPTITECKSDSLQSVIDLLQTEYRILDDGCANRENRYEDIISEYELGVSYLEDYYPNAYRDFHRIIGMKERYNQKLDRENKQRLRSYE